MSNSKLVTYTAKTDHYGYKGAITGRGGKKIDKIFVHHMAGNLSVQQCGNVFRTRTASAHYGINGKNIGLYVDESNAAWHCGNKDYNQRSIGIECANDGGSGTNWHVSDTTIETLIKLIVDICKRNGIKRINYTGGLDGNLCMHCWTQSTACPGGYLKSKFKYIANECNKRMNAPAEKTWTDYKVPFTVRVSIDDLYIRKGAGIQHYGRQTVDGSQFIKKGVYTITEVKQNEGYYWGKLKSSTASSPRWIALDYTTFVKEVTEKKGPAKVNPKLTALEKAALTQCDWMYHSTYKWQANPTIAKSKTRGTCVTYVACVLQRIGAIKPGQYIYFDKGRVYGAITSDMQVIYCQNKRPSQVTLKKGDIVMHDDTKSGHIEIYAGQMKDGKAKYWTGGCGSGHNTSKAYWNNRTILAIVRLKSVQ